MKPKIFIGSSVESLEIANNLQVLLEHQSTPTVWSQGIFELNSSALDSLIKAVDNTDYAIFVFKPEDIAIMRDSRHNVVRDNVIFELGLFLGRLGKERVFFVAPRNADNFHLPTDLLGITYGKYDSERPDGNLQAALAPFITSISPKLKEFVFDNLNDLQDENLAIKKIALEKKEFWQYYLTAELVKDRMIEVTSRFEDIENGFVYESTRSLNSAEYIIFVKDRLIDITKFLDVFQQLFGVELGKAYQIKDDQAKILAIKSTIDKLTNACKRLLNWEIELISVTPPSQMINIPRYMKGWSKSIIDKLIMFPNMVYERVNHEYITENKKVDLILVFDSLPNSDQFNEEFARVIAEMN
ncbi:Predicted nucleotide-binding protein containing TIR-like domain-containing protein [Chryseobacterium oleae]|uniref:Predicted nucleotide-binding protein containing TIR-like domain-containing protein n=1 Tax=Chryseobacterium oleae TaxID=491207 RepID=A0A1I4VYQ2_CHROL|nr:nucleotide-binding protein [Chryseobacterium oleae]SFN06177.1 Predicted nucleotide-binding protein containing TIR-like domain-containing protein [Chryseobacterium oleae]